MRSIFFKYNNLAQPVKASLWYMICTFLQKAISVITTPIFTRIMTTSEYGSFNVFMSWMGIFQVVVSLNLFAGYYVSGLVKNKESQKDFENSIYELTCLLVIVWLGLCYVFSEFVFYATGITKYQMIMMFLLIITSDSYYFWAAEQRVENKYKELLFITMIVSIAKPVVGIFGVIASSRKMEARIIGMVIAELICYVPIFFARIKNIHKLNTKYWKEALLFTLPLIPHYLSTMILNSSDRIMIARMCGEAEAGIYSLAYSIAMLMMMVSTAIVQAVEPWLYKKIQEKEFSKISKVFNGSILFVALINLVFITMAPEVVYMFAPLEYQDAIWIIPPVAASVYYIFLYSFFAVFEFYFAKTKSISLATCLGAIFNLMLNFFFIPRFGYLAASYTTLICYMLYSLMHYHYMKKICKEKFKIRPPYNIGYLLFLSIVFTVVSLSVTFSYQNGIIRLVMTSMILLVVLFNKEKINTFIREIIGR